MNFFYDFATCNSVAKKYCLLKDLPSICHSWQFSSYWAVKTHQNSPPINALISSRIGKTHKKHKDVWWMDIQCNRTLQWHTVYKWWHFTQQWHTFRRRYFICKYNVNFSLCFVSSSKYIINVYFIAKLQ